MKKLSKAQSTQLDTIADALVERYDALDTAIGAYNAAMEEAWTAVDEALGAYNETLSEARELRGDIVDQIQNHIDDKSEKWQDSDKGQAYESWRQQWEQIDLEEVEIDKPDELELNADNPEGLFADVPQEIEE